MAITNDKSQSLTFELAAASHKITSLELDTINANSKARSLEYECAELKNKIMEMEHSRSWRITKPLRSVMWFFRRLFGKKEK